MSLEDAARAAGAVKLITRAGGVDVCTEYGRNTLWSATATWAGSGTLEVDGARSIADALEALAALAYENALCNHCARLVALHGLTDRLVAVVTTNAVGDPPCVWRRRYAEWVRGCA